MRFYKKSMTLDKLLFSLFAFALTMQGMVKNAPFGNKQMLYAVFALGVGLIVLVSFIVYPRTTLYGYFLGAITGTVVGVVFRIVFHQLWLDAVFGFIGFAVMNFFVQRRNDKILLSDDEGRR